MMRPPARIAATMLLVATAGCATRNHGAGGAHIVRSPIELIVDNKSSADITIYVVHDGRTERLDRIEAVRKKVLAIPPRMFGTLGDLRLLGERQGARAGFAGRILMQTVTPQPCLRLEWTIEARLEQSTLGVFPAEQCNR